LTGSRVFAAPEYADRSFWYSPGFHRGYSYGRGFHLRFFVVGANLRFYDWAYDDYGSCSVLTAYGWRRLC
jgi:hypothetical protein